MKATLKGRHYYGFTFNIHFTKVYTPLECIGFGHFCFMQQVFNMKACILSKRKIIMQTLDSKTAFVVTLWLRIVSSSFPKVLADLRTDIRFQKLIVWVCFVHITFTDSFCFVHISMLRFCFKCMCPAVWTPVSPTVPSAAPAPKPKSLSIQWVFSINSSVTHTEHYNSISLNHRDFGEPLSIMNRWLHSFQTIPGVCLDLIIIRLQII